MEERYLDYLATLEELRQSLEQLAATAQQKTAAVKQDDLAALNEILKQEQAISLALRGLEQKRTKQMTELNLADAPLSRLAERYPEALRLQAKNTADALLRQYQLYQSASDAARCVLESNLHEIEKILADLGADPMSGASYAPAGADLPSSMKTDFRA